MPFLKSPATPSWASEYESSWGGAGVRGTAQCGSRWARVLQFTEISQRLLCSFCGHRQRSSLRWTLLAINRSVLQQLEGAAPRALGEGVGESRPSGAPGRPCRQGGEGVAGQIPDRPRCGPACLGGGPHTSRRAWDVCLQRGLGPLVTSGVRLRALGVEFRDEGV